MSCLLCPICGEAFAPAEAGLRCPNGHCFDRARQGYVNLLPGASGQHGDDRPMVLARRRFLDTGAYGPLADALCALLAADFPENGLLLDAGCGECWYTARMAQALSSRRPHIVGIDVSRDALKAAGARMKPLDRWELAVASSFRLPVADHSCAALTCVFAPSAPEEFRRVLTAEGRFYRVSPLPDHLWELKSAVYPHPVENDPPTPMPGFRLLASHEVRTEVSLASPEEIQALFYMTPYAYRTDPAGKQRLEALTSLSTRAAFRIEVFVPEA